MPSDTASVLCDMEQHIRLAMQFADGMHLVAIQQDVRTVYAVTRCLEIVSEASRRLPEEIKSRHPSIPWKEIAGAGNVYRHDYEDVAARVIWDTVQRALPPLQTAIVQEIERICSSPDAAF